MQFGESAETSQSESCNNPICKPESCTSFRVQVTNTNQWTCRSCFNLFIELDLGVIESGRKWDRKVSLSFTDEPTVLKFAGPVVSIDRTDVVNGNYIFTVAFKDDHEFGNGQVSFNAGEL